MKHLTNLALACFLALGLFSHIALAGQITQDPNQPLPSLGCTKGTGTLLCKQLNNIAVLTQYRCEGTPCYALWREYLRVSENFIDLYDSLEFTKYVTQVDLAEAAKTTSGLVCALQLQGDTQWIAAIAIKLEAVMRRAETLQRSAEGNFELKTCRITMGPINN